VWIGLTLSGVAWIGMQLFTSRPAGDAMAVTIWGSRSELDADGAAALRLDGRDPVPHAPVADMFKGLAPWMQALPGRLLHTNVVGCAIFAAVSGSSAATCATIGKMTCPSWQARGYPDGISVGSLAGCRHAGPADSRRRSS
jgi:C4-dicarboxylate transporter, DctM subunit